MGATKQPDTDSSKWAVAAHVNPDSLFLAQKWMGRLKGLNIKEIQLNHAVPSGAMLLFLAP